MAHFNHCFRVAFLAVLFPLTSGACVDLDLGMGSRTIPDSKITASSVQSVSTPAKNGRLNFTSGSSWCAGTSDTNPYLQIDLQTLHIICAVSTQGNSQADQWVKNYMLQLSTNGTTWTDYMEFSGQVKVLEGNKDRNSNVKHVLYGVLTRYLRFLPQKHQGEVCMRTEVFGVKQKPTCDSQAIGLASGGRIPDNSFSASSIFAPPYAAKYGRLNGRGAWEPRTTTDRTDYLQIDLLYEYVICAVATQGNPPIRSSAQEWTTEYKLRFSLNGTIFLPYKENKLDKAFPGNSGKTDTVKNSLKEFASAKFIRFLPTKYNRFKALRVEAYGILFTKVPSKPPTAFKLTARSSTSITASWQSPPVFARHGRKITGFKLFYKKKGGGSATALLIGSGSILSRNVTGLDKFMEYEFQVLALTSDGDGPKSPVEVERTKEAAPSKAPSSFRVTAVTSTIITASWQLPPADSRNGIIIGFKLFYKKRGSGGQATTLTIKNGTALSKDVAGLDIYTEYEFEVLAFTSVGDGPRSSPLVVVRTTKDGCVEFSLGMEDGRILDTGINASSSSTLAKNGRLNYTSGSSWCAGTSDTNPYLQIDLQTLHIICAVSTQGNLKADQWVKSYTLQLSTDGTTWTDYTELGGQVKVLVGNDDKNSEVKHVVYGILTRYLRFRPQTHQGGVCMRIEVFGVKQKPTCDSQAIGLASGGRIPDDSFSASSIFIPRYAAKYGRLNGRRAWEPKTTTDPTDYLQIDLLYEYVICAVATQGNPPTQSASAQEWTTEYKLRFSLNGTTFLPYKGNKLDKAFPGNSGKTDTVKNSLKEFASAKFIRFLPTKYNVFKALRVEAYGILFTKVPSQPPTAFKLTATSSISIAASWQLPPAYARHATVIGFKVFYTKKVSGVSVTILTIKGESTLSKNVTGLDKYTEYEFQVLAFTSDGDGPKSSVEVERTMEDVPSKPPSYFNLTASSSTSITASWQLPPKTSRNGIIKGFKLFYQKKGSAGSELMRHITDQAKRLEEVTSLDKFTEYEFKILAFTSVGDGPKSSILTERTKEDAHSLAPTKFSVSASSSTSITASWLLPPVNSRHGIIKGFKLFYKRNGSSDSATSLNIRGGATQSKIVTGLDKYTEYELQVLAFTSAGDGPKSPSQVVRTREDAPDAPTSLSYTDLSPSKSHGPRITLTWSEPAEPNGVIRSYTLFYSHDGVAPREISGIGKDALTHTVDVLGGVTYQFNVRAVTIKPGKNATKTLTTKEYEPSRGPADISSSAVSSEKFNITWLGLLRDVAYGIIINYEVRLSVVENCTEIKSFYDSTINTTTTYVIVTGLSLCAKYEVSVRGYTAEGPGPYSNPVMVQTLAVVWSKETPSSPSFSANSDEGGISVKVTLPRFPGNARFFQVIIITYGSNYTGAVNPPGRFTTQDMMTYEEAHKSTVPAAYVAFQFGGNDFDNNRDFVVGDGAESSSKERSKRSSGDQFYYNKPLQPNTNYKVFLRAFYSETVYVSSNFVNIDTKGKPIIKGLPKTIITEIGELAVLTCEVSGDAKASVTWTKDGLGSIPRAQFENNGKILIIRDVVPGDSGVYECNAMNMFGESRTATTVIVAVPPIIIEEISPSSVMCAKQTPCLLSCQATSYIPFNYSWTKDGQVPTGDGIKLMNNSIIVTPRNAQDYGQYVCHATNSFGSTEYKITLLSLKDNEDDGGKCSQDDTQSIFLASVIAFSCIVVVLLIIICGLIWQRRRAVPSRRTQGNEKVDFDGVKSSTDQQLRDQHASDPDLYMELKPRPSNQESHVPSEYQSLQEEPENPGYYNMVLQKENGVKQNEEVYEELC
ncbi:protein sidekick-1-like isoform X3 [Pocillopora verrucosa]|uniref:protein sidekick-1-like isoform X3 n=1 Tax=Pocillopora verrucosa TaxID=203993 RepID=UPI00333FACC1